jgi:hypothetical protein
MFYIWLGHQHHSYFLHAGNHPLAGIFGLEKGTISDLKNLAKSTLTERFYDQYSEKLLNPH